MPLGITGPRFSAIPGAIDLDPSEAKALSLAGSLAYILGRDAEGIDLCRQAVAHNPIGPYERLILGYVLAFHALGQNEAADAALQEAIENYAETMPYQIGLVYAYRGDADQAFSWFERAYLQRDPGLAWYFRTDPLLANVKSDRRYVGLLRRMKLPEN